MSRDQWKRLHLAEWAKQGVVTAAEAARALGLSVRQWRRVRRAIEASGDAAVRHGGAGRRPNNRLDDAVSVQILALARGRYAGFNDHHLTEKLVEVEGIKVSRSTVQRTLRSAAVASPRKRRPRKHHRRRDRKAQEGMMLLWDGSRHDWLEGRGPRLCLVGAIDDATGALMPGAHFVDQESTVAYLRVLRDVCRAKGVPAAIYMDRHGSLKRNDDHWTLSEELCGQQAKTQVGRALEELGIEAIFALSPQAKGRVERLWNTLQDRLTSELRLAEASTEADANAVLQAYTPHFCARFAIPAEQTESAWTAIEPAEVDRICALSFETRIRNDSTVHHDGTVVDLGKGADGRTRIGCVADVRVRLDGLLDVRVDGEILACQPERIAPPTLVRRRARLPVRAQAPTQDRPRPRRSFAQICDHVRAAAAAPSA